MPPRVYGGQSQYLIRQSEKFSKYEWVSMTVYAVGLVLYVFSYPKFLLLQSRPLLAVMVLLGAVLFYFALYRVAIRAGIQSRNYLKGFWGEKNIMCTLNVLSDDYAVFRNVRIGEYGDIDFIVIGPTGIFAIEVKSHSGYVGFNGHELVRNGRWKFEKDFLHQTMSGAVKLSNLIRERANEQSHVIPVLVFSSRFARVRFGTDKIKGVYVVQKQWLNKIIAEQPKIADTLRVKAEECLRSLVEEEELKTFQNIAARDVLGTLGSMSSREAQFYRNLKR